MIRLLTYFLSKLFPSNDILEESHFKTVFMKDEAGLEVIQ
jgi:hypothetical protein